MNRLRSGVAWAGIAAGGAAWAASTQVNYALVGSGAVPGAAAAWIAFGLAAAALAGGALSWAAWRNPWQSLGHASGSPKQFLAGLGTLTSLVFAAAIALQGVAALIVR